MPEQSTVIKAAIVFGTTLTIGVLTELIYQGFRWLKSRNTSRSKTKIFSKVLFFPDKQVACKAFFQTRIGCSNINCRYSHKETSFSELYRQLGNAKQCLDVCVFVICCKDLADILIKLHKQGKKVRVITDDEQVDMPVSQIWRFRKEGISVRTDHSPYFMHHKFVVVDRKVLINGSFNWTRRAITGNQENLLISNNPHFVNCYIEEFEKLWEEFDPKNFNDSNLYKTGHQLNGDVNEQS